MVTFRWSSHLLLSLLLITLARSQIISLTAQEFRNGIDSGLFDVVADVRTQGEFYEYGHIEGATLVESLAAAGSAYEVTNASALAGCQYCNIVVYCRSGARAGAALKYLQWKGFRRLYDGGGIGEWRRAGFPIVNTTSVVAQCTVNADKSDACQQAWSATQPTAAPTIPTTPAPVATTACSKGLNELCVHDSDCCGSDTKCGGVCQRSIAPETGKDPDAKLSTAGGGRGKTGSLTASPAPGVRRRRYLKGM